MVQKAILKNEATLIQLRGDTYYVQKHSNEFKVKKLKASHKLRDCNDYVQFDFHEESDGTNRIIDLIPLLYMLEQGHTVIIDEIDRSLHSLISIKIFDLFFKNTLNIPSQIIATTHDLMLLNLNIIRRDEIWFIKKDQKRQSILYSLEQFKTRFDTKLLKAYLDGRFGAIPILIDEALDDISS
jgi:hypothetical protein